MADPLSIASGVAGLLSLGIDVTKTLVDFYSAYKDQTPAVAKTMMNLESLLGILRSLDGAVQNRQPQTDALLQEIDKAAVACRGVIEELRDECQKFKKDPSLSLKGRIQVAGHRATYPLRQSTLQKLEEIIGEIRGTLSLALNVLQLRNHTGLEDGISELKILVEQTSTFQISATIRDWLKAPDATIDHNAACEKRHTNTGLWLVNGQEFQKWLIEPNSFLWINGFAGCGKSVLCSTAVQAVRRMVRDRQHQPSIGIGFFYFSFSDESKKDCSGMLRALLLQLSAQLEEGEKDLRALYESYEPGTPPVKVLLNSLKQTISKFSVTYILIDALDESPRDDKREYVLDAVKKFRQWDLPTLHLLVTSRNELDIRYSLETPSCEDISMRNPETDMDIQNFISYELSNDPKLQRWKSRHDDIREQLMDKAQGVFRYVECQLLALKRARIRNELDKCLRSLPRDLDETYERMLCSIDEEYSEEARLILTLLCMSKQPLTVEELVGALAIDLTKLELDRDGRSFCQDDPIDICLGLIEVAVIEDEYGGLPSTIARIAHFSVQEYLESDRISQQGAAKFAIRKEAAHTEIAQICLAYLLDPTLSNGKLDEPKLEMFPFAHFAAVQWSYFYNNSGNGKSDIERLILRLFRDQKESFLTWARLYDMDLGMYESDWERAAEEIPSPLYYAALLGLVYVSSALIARWRDEFIMYAEVNAHRGEYGTALQAAASEGQEKVVQILLDYSADVSARGGHYGNALQAAAYGGYEKIVQILLDHGADINARGGHYGNALQAAASRGHKKVVQILLDHSAEVNSNGLQAAASGGHEKVVQILLDHSADINAQGGYYGTALQVAASGGYEKVVQILLDHSAEVNSNGLQAAASGGHEKVVQILLDHGADINAQGGYYGTALQAAASEGYEKIVQILLDHEADTNARGGHYGNALQAAAFRGYEKIVQILLDHGADTNAQGGYYGTALQAAASGGYEKIVQILLDHGADTNAQGGYYSNALQAAASGGYEKIVQILLDHGADINWSGPLGTALLIASERCHEMVVQVLLDNGAEDAPVVGKDTEKSSGESAMWASCVALPLDMISDTFERAKWVRKR
ncbi:NACHT nucleoside triphosphatase [Penicillium griseofulvum]|uniref:NACHT nucleoside triphosphatase n=1 Tax=Penicillium patulum TaxID=5078 RepID=A0A135LAU2_PENPA|nr:NACHT nucleoside triphosphatase [Penicillium griseofulvum]KXG46054.1 NACHT nucleoside triphosphatase [Penicillium griseofulvum]